MEPGSAEWILRKRLEGINGDAERYADWLFDRVDFDYEIFTPPILRLTSDRTLRQLERLGGVITGAREVIDVLENGSDETNPRHEQALEYIGITYFGAPMERINGGLLSMTHVVDDLVRINFVAQKRAARLIARNPGRLTPELEARLCGPYRPLPPMPQLHEIYGERVPLEGPPSGDPDPNVPPPRPLGA
jgi:hypothetical protein